MGTHIEEALVDCIVSLAESKKGMRETIRKMQDRDTTRVTNALRHGEKVRGLREEITQKAGMITRLEADVAAINTRFVNAQRALDTAYRLMTKSQRTKLARQVKAYAAATDEDFAEV